MEIDELVELAKIPVYEKRSIRSDFSLQKCVIDFWMPLFWG
jgi:hypothetical protein